MVEHLIEVHRHPSIALVVGEGSTGARINANSGWQSSHAGRRPARRTAGPDQPSAVRAATTRRIGLLDTQNPPTAIFASSDLQAVGALRAIRERGLRVPEDVAVVAFDGTKESEFTWPPMTVARQPVREMAVTCRRSRPVVRRQNRVTGCRMDLIIRQSCGLPSDGSPRAAARHLDQKGT